MRNFKSFIAGIEEATAATKIPPIFRKWAALSAVAGALGKRNWYDQGAFDVYPNMFIILIAEPGRGKTLSLTVPFFKVFTSLSSPPGKLSDSPDFNARIFKYNMVYPLHIISNRITPERLAIELEKCCRTEDRLNTVDNEFLVKYYEAPLTLITSEFGVFMRRTDEYLHLFMTDMWDCQEKYHHLTKTQGDTIIKGPCLNWIACATPEQFVKNLPDSARSQGLLSRMIPVWYNGEETKDSLYYTKAKPELLHFLREDLAEISQMCGKFAFCEEAFKLASADVDGGLYPAPIDINMSEYKQRRLSHLLKVVMSVSASKRNDHIITTEDWQEARTLINEAESFMPNALENFGKSKVGYMATDLTNFIRRYVQINGTDGVEMEKILVECLRIAANPNDVMIMIQNMLQAKLLSRVGNIIKVGAA